MNNKRRNIYLAVIIACFLGTGGVLYYGFGGGSSGTSTDVLSAVPGGSATGLGTLGTPPSAGTGASAAVGRASYPIPTVFPNDTKFDWTFLQSDKFKSLTGLPGLVLDQTQIGHNNPFSP
jgi:hypothetical protein